MKTKTKMEMGVEEWRCEGLMGEMEVTKTRVLGIETGRTYSKTWVSENTLLVDGMKCRYLRGIDNCTCPSYSFQRNQKEPLEGS